MELLSLSPPVSTSLNAPFAIRRIEFSDPTFNTLQIDYLSENGTVCGFAAKSGDPNTIVGFEWTTNQSRLLPQYKQILAIIPSGKIALDKANRWVWNDGSKDIPLETKPTWRTHSVFRVSETGMAYGYGYTGSQFELVAWLHGTLIKEWSLPTGYDYYFSILDAFEETAVGICHRRATGDYVPMWIERQKKAAQVLNLTPIDKRNKGFITSINSDRMMVGFGGGLIVDPSERPIPFSVTKGALKALNLRRTHVVPTALNKSTIGGHYVKFPSEESVAILHSMRTGWTDDLNDRPDVQAAGWKLNKVIKINEAGFVVGYGTLNGVKAGYALGA